MSNPISGVGVRRIALPSRSIPVRPGGAAIALAVPPGPDTVQLDPFLFPPPNSIPINVSGSVGINGPAGTRFDQGLSFRVPRNSYGVISMIDLLLDSILISSNVLWTLLINQRPVPGFSPITILGRNGAASVSKSWPGPLRIVIPLGGIVTATVQDVDGGVYTAGMQLYGWHFTQQRS